MSEEIKIGVSAPGVEAASARIKELQARINELRKAGQGYEDKGMDPAAKSARQDAARLEKDIANHRKESAKEDREATRERVRAAAEEKLTTGRTRRVVGAVANFAESQAGASGFGGLTSAIRAGGGPVGAIAAAAAAIAATVIASEASRSHTMRMAELEDQSARATDKQGLKRLAAYGGGDSAAAFAVEKAAMDKRVSLAAKTDELMEAAKPKWYKPSEFGAWFNNKVGGDSMMTIDGEAALRSNTAEMGREKSKQQEAKEIKEKKFAEGPALELKALEERSLGHRKEAYAIEQKKKWNDEYNKSLAEGAEEWQAQEKASLVVHQDNVQRSQSMARSVNARSGAGDVRAAARMAQEFLGGGAVVKELGSLREQLASQHMDIKNAHPIPKFGPRLPR